MAAFPYINMIVLHPALGHGAHPCLRLPVRSVGTAGQEPSTFSSLFYCSGYRTQSSSSSPDESASRRTL